MRDSFNRLLFPFAALISCWAMMRGCPEMPAIRFLVLGVGIGAVCCCTRWMLDHRCGLAVRGVRTAISVLGFAWILAELTSPDWKAWCSLLATLVTGCLLTELARHARRLHWSRLWSLRQLFAWTTLVALAMSLLRYSRLPWEHLGIVGGYLVGFMIVYLLATTRAQPTANPGNHHQPWRELLHRAAHLGALWYFSLLLASLEQLPVWQLGLAATVQYLVIYAGRWLPWEESADDIKRHPAVPQPEVRGQETGLLEILPFDIDAS